MCRGLLRTYLIGCLKAHIGYMGCSEMFRDVFGVYVYRVFIGVCTVIKVYKGCPKRVYRVYKGVHKGYNMMLTP